MRLVFMGTPSFAVTILEGLVQAGHEIVAVYTQPDRPQGRGKKLNAPPVKTYALEHGLRVLQPQTVKDHVFLDSFQAWQADAAVVAAYGRILPEAALNMPRFGCINVHASILPRYRGAAPIQWAIRNGDEETGVSIMKMAVGMDTGPVYAQAPLLIRSDETSGSLFERLAESAAALLLETLERIIQENLQPVDQPEIGVSYAPMFSASDEEIDWMSSAVEIERLNRALLPSTCLHTKFQGKRLKLVDLKTLADDADAAPGEIVAVQKNALLVATGRGTLKITRVQPAGKKPMDVQQFLNGQPLQSGERFQARLNQEV